MAIECQVYDIKDVAAICNVSENKASGIIRALNEKLVKLGTPKGAITSGRVSKKFFHEETKI